MEEPTCSAREPEPPARDPATPRSDPRSPQDPGDAALEAALADPAFDEVGAVQDPGRPEDPLGEPGAPHLALDGEQADAP